MSCSAKHFVSAACAVLALAAFSGAARGDGPPQRPAGEGVLCVWGFVAVATEVADRCFAGQDPALQAALHQARDRMDAYVMANEPSTAADIANFHKVQGMGGSSTDQLCHGDPVTLYQGLKGEGPDKIHALVESLLAKPGKPSWGACV